MRLFPTVGRRAGALLAAPALTAGFLVSLMAGPAAASCSAQSWSVSRSGASASGWDTYDCNGKLEVWGTLSDTSCDGYSAHFRVRWYNHNGILNGTNDKWVDACNTSGTFYFSRSTGSTGEAQVCVRLANNWDWTGWTCRWVI
jgi:hypothetical protein